MGMPFWISYLSFIVVTLAAPVQSSSFNDPTTDQLREQSFLSGKGDLQGQSLRPPSPASKIVTDNTHSKVDQNTPPVDKNQKPPVDKIVVTAGDADTKANAPKKEEPNVTNVPKKEPDHVDAPKKEEPNHVGLAGESHIPAIDTLTPDLTPEQAAKKKEQKEKSDQLHKAMKEEKEAMEVHSGVKNRDAEINAAVKPLKAKVGTTHGWANLMTISISISSLLLILLMWVWYHHNDHGAAERTPLMYHQSRTQTVCESMRESVATFLNAPGQLHLILLVQCLESLKWYSTLAILPLLLSNEYQYSDVQAAVAVGNFTLLSVLFSFGGSVLVDRVGIGTYTRWSSFLGCITRIVMVYFSQSSIFLLCLVVLIPMFESALGSGTKTAIVRLTANSERDFAFAISYSVVNAAGAVGFMFADHVKDSLYMVGDHRISGLRFVLLLTSCVQLCAWICGLFVENVADPRLTDSDIARKKQVSVMRQLQGFVNDPDCWRALTFQVATMFAALQWQLAETLLPKYLTRIYGVEVMWGTVTSINQWTCTVLPPIISALLMGFSDFGVIVPGLVIFALSPVAMIFFPNLPGSVLWIVLLSIGEVIWSPRSQSYLAALSPVQGQALFLSMVHSPRVAFNFIRTVVGGMLLGNFVPQCSECQDSLGFFCDGIISATEQAQIGEATRWSPNIDFAAHFSEPAKCKSTTTNEYCGIHPDLALQPCPSNCTECPGWSHDGRSMWAMVLAVSMITPVVTIMMRRRLERKSEAAPGEAPDNMIEG